MTGSASLNIALSQSGNGIVRPKIFNSNGNRDLAKNNKTSHGALRKNWVVI